MSSEYDDIKNSIKEIALSGETLHSLLCFIEKIDENKLTCSVVSADGLSSFDNVRLKEVTKESTKQNGVWMIPAKDSRVIVDFIGVGQPYITMVSEIDKLCVIVETVRMVISAKGIALENKGDMRMAITSKGFSLENKKESKDLKKTLDTLLDFLAKEYKVQTAWGPSGPAMKDAADKIEEFKGDFAKILLEGKDNATD